MKKTTLKQLTILSLTAFMLGACGGSGSSTTKEESAIDKIEAYADNGGTAPTVQDYVNAGVTGVTTENLEDINEIVENLTAQEVDTPEEIQALVNANGGGSPVDNNAPVITLQGKNPYYLQQSGTYHEAGATAVDAVDGTVNVTISGEVEIHKVGDYTVTYTAQDKEGHTATATRVVHVIPIVHLGVTYGTVISPYTGKVWLDKNVGAAEVCTTPKNKKCFGGYYQWGRNTDGHQKPDSKTTLVSGKTLTDLGDKFFISHNYGDDWTSAKNRSENWRATDGRSVCPVGYRVPSIKELEAELSDPHIDQGEQWIDFLKLPHSGVRLSVNGDIIFASYSDDLYTHLWSHSVSDNTSSYVIQSSYGDFPFYSGSSSRSDGYPIRCIQN